MRQGPLVTDTTEDRELKKAQKAMDKLKRKVPQKVSGRHLFLRDLVLEAKAGLQGGEKLPHSTRMALVSKHTGVFQRLSPAAQSVYNEAAHRHAAVAAQQVADEMVRMETSEALRQAKVSAEAVAGALATRLSSHRWVDEDFARLEELWESNDFSGAALAALREKSLVPPGPPTFAAQALLEGVPKVFVPATALPPIAPWARAVCRNRDEFKNAALVFESGGKRTFFYFVLASKNPEFIMLAELQQLTPWTPNVQGKSLSQLFLARALFTKFKFRAVPGKFVLDRGLSTTADTRIMVLQHLLWLRRGCMGSDADLVDLATIAVDTPRRPSAKAKSRSSKASAVDPALLARHPWPQGHFDNQQAAARSGGATSSASQHVLANDEEAQPALGDEAVEHASKALESTRREWEAAPAVSQPDFVLKTRGGAWTMAHTGKAADSVRGEVKGQLAKEWCALAGLTKSATFAFSR